jgi:hypothetical protein
LNLRRATNSEPRAARSRVSGFVLCPQPDVEGALEAIIGDILAPAQEGTHGAAAG